MEEDRKEMKKLHRLASSQQPHGPTSVEEVTDEVWLLTKLAFLLIRCMGAGSEWIIRCTRLAIFSLILLPCFLRHFWFYFTSSHILKNVSYGRNSRNSLDLYIPFRRHQSDDTPKKWPVLICFSGGAWIIGYKAWSGLVGKMMMEHGILLVTPDYRNFPQGLVSDMLEDYNAAIRWVFQNIDAYGGDVDNIYIMGQSAGAHLSALALIDNAERQLFLHPSNGDSHLHLPHSWRVSDVKAYIGVSGVYDLPKATAHIHDRGLYKSVLFSIMEGELSLHSPSLRVERMKRRWQSRRALQRMQQKDERSEGANDEEEWKKLAEEFPRVVLIHGKKDKTIPWVASQGFAEALHHAGLGNGKAEEQQPLLVKYYNDKTHTDAIVEDVFLGRNEVLWDVIDIILGQSPDEEEYMLPEVSVDKAADKGLLRSLSLLMVVWGWAMLVALYKVLVKSLLRGEREKEKEEKAAEKEEMERGLRKGELRRRERRHKLTARNQRGYPLFLIQLAKRMNPF